jgi:hypothetical protein
LEKEAGPAIAAVLLQRQLAAAGAGGFITWYPSSALSFVGLPAILKPFFPFFFEINFEGGDFSIRNFHNQKL